MKDITTLKWNLWLVETGVLAWALFLFDWKVLGLMFLSLWWTKLHTKVAGIR